MSKAQEEERNAANDQNLAFEIAFPGDEPFDLWRVTAWRTHNSSRLRHTNWFANESQAWEHAGLITEQGGEVVSVGHYRLVPPGPPNPPKGAYPREVA